MGKKKVKPNAFSVFVREFTARHGREYPRVIKMFDQFFSLELFEIMTFDSFAEFRYVQSGQAILRCKSPLITIVHQLLFGFFLPFYFHHFSLTWAHIINFVLNTIVSETVGSGKRAVKGTCQSVATANGDKASKVHIARDSIGTSWSGATGIGRKEELHGSKDQKYRRQRLFGQRYVVCVCMKWVMFWKQ